MVSLFLPVLLFVAFAAALSIGLAMAGRLVGPHRDSAVKRMPYESGMDPIQDARQRFDVRFHLVAIAFLVFDVELLFLYPWAVASRPGAAEAASKDGTSLRAGIDAAVAHEFVSSRGLVFGEVMVFIALLALGFAYAWRKGVFRWR
jgi:NADH-quinone oxidoreductase subunit A